jgi:uncharacterized tellurite resistance protein B-like protein
VRKKLALLTMAAVLPVFAMATADGDVHGPELKRAHHVEIDDVKILPKQTVQVTATLTYADKTKAHCTYLMATSVLKQETGAGFWIIPIPGGENCFAVK